jgi:hypothetical protein
LRLCNSSEGKTPRALVPFPVREFRDEVDSGEGG